MIASIIIPSYNGANKVVNLLRALEDQSYKNFEVFVVIDGSTDDTLEKLQNFNTSFPFKVLNQVNKGRAASRNNGYKMSNGELIIFFDDDTRPDPECVKGHIEHHKENENTILVGGIYEDLRVMKTDIQKYKVWLSNLWSSHLSDEGKIDISNKNYLSAANLSMSRSTFEKLSGFDNSLRDHEDFELGLRAVQQGVKIFLNPKLYVWHDDFITMKSYIKRNREYWTAKQELLRLRPEYSHVILSGNKVRMFSLKKFFYFPFSMPIWITVVDKSDFLKILPQGIRFKMYNYIIAAFYLYYPKRKI